MPSMPPTPPLPSSADDPSWTAARSALLAGPWTLGDGPFRAKGEAFRGHLAYVAELVPGGVDAMIERTPDPVLRRFWAQPFLASSRYDVFPLVFAGFTCAELVGTDPGAFVYTRSIAQAERDIHGVYRALLRFVSAETIALRLPKLMLQYFDFGQVEGLRASEREVHGEFVGIPAAIAPWFATVVRAYAATAIRVGGSAAPAVEFVAARDGGVAHGHPLRDLPFRIRLG
jgi:hypothetical protein